MSLPVNEIFQGGRPLLGAFAFLVGAIIGSFINVISLRLPRMMEQNWRAQCCELLDIQQQPNEKELIFNLAFPASHCPQCSHVIRWWENIPVISYIFLKGKCSNCKKNISIQYPLVELITAVLSATVVWHMGLTNQACAALFLTWSLITLASIDTKTQLLPDDITLPLVWLGLALNIFSVFTSLQNAVIGAMIGYLSLWLIYWVFKLLMKKEGMGYGDFKLLAALGAWMGWQALPMIILLSSLVGAVAGITWMIAKRRDSQVPIPFGPYLAAAGWITLLWGSDITSWYFSFYAH